MESSDTIDAIAGASSMEVATEQEPQCYSGASGTISRGGDSSTHGDKRKPPTSTEHGNLVNHRRPRKERDPNWNKMEILSMVIAKREEFLQDLDCDDARDLMGPETTKWGKIAMKVNSAGHSPCHRDGAACKYKWHTLLSDYKHIADFHAVTGRNSEQYFSLTFAQRREQNVPRAFFQDVYDSMAEWLSHKPTINPPHFRDLLNPMDSNFDTATTAAIPGTSIAGTHSGCHQDATLFANPTSVPEEPINMSTNSESPSWSAGPSQTIGTEKNPVGGWFQASTATTASMHPSPAYFMSIRTHGRPQMDPSDPIELPPLGATTHRDSEPIRDQPTKMKYVAPVSADSTRHATEVTKMASSKTTPLQHPQIGVQGLSPHVLPSSGRFVGNNQRQCGNTGVRRKNNTAMKKVAEATAASSDKLIDSLKSINDTNKEMEANRIALDMRIFEEEIKYRRERDQMALENAKLALLNQNLVVQAISNLATAIGHQGTPSCTPLHSSTTDTPSVATPATGPHTEVDQHIEP